MDQTVYILNTNYLNKFLTNYIIHIKTLSTDIYCLFNYSHLYTFLPFENPHRHKQSLLLLAMCDVEKATVYQDKGTICENTCFGIYNVNR